MVSKTVSSLSRSNMYKWISFFGVVFLGLLLITAGNVACKKQSGEEAVEEEGVSIKEGVIEFEGTVKIAHGKFVYIPEAQGFDVVIQGTIDSGDTTTLIDKEVRGTGIFSPDHPSILVAENIEMKDEMGSYRSVFTRSEAVTMEDFIDVSTRQEFLALINPSHDKMDDWDGKEKLKVYGRLEEEGDSFKIAVLNERGNQVGKVVIDNLSDYAHYYVKKLRLFGDFWFYVNVKDTVDWSTRRSSREMFHADVLFAGLF
jgi:hypothetical protein